jgi:hypothetical protein
LGGLGGAPDFDPIGVGRDLIAPRAPDLRAAPTGFCARGVGAGRIANLAHMKLTCLRARVQANVFRNALT